MFYINSYRIRCTKRRRDSKMQRAGGAFKQGGYRLCCALESDLRLIKARIRRTGMTWSFITDSETLVRVFIDWARVRVARSFRPNKGLAGIVGDVDSSSKFTPGKSCGQFIRRRLKLWTKVRKVTVIKVGCVLLIVKYEILELVF